MINVINVQRKKNRWDERSIKSFFELLLKLKIEVENIGLTDHKVITALCKKHILSAYDASYLYIAIKNKIPLATQDKALKKAAQKEGVFFS